jgi:hypothetical protein
MTSVNGSMRYQDASDTSLPRRAHQSSGAQHPPWDGEDSAFDNGGELRPGAYGNDAFDNGAYRGSAYRGPAYSGPAYGAPAYGAPAQSGPAQSGPAYGDRGYRNTGSQPRTDDFDAFGGAPPRRSNTGGFGAVGAVGFNNTGGFSSTDGFSSTGSRGNTGGFSSTGAVASRYPSASDATSVDELTAIGGRRYGVTEQAAADADDDPGRGRHRGGGQQPARRSLGLLAGGVSGFLAAGTALGMANLVAAFVRPQASPIIAVGGWFIDHTPPALKEFAIEKFGENDKNMLLLGMYVTIALIAIVIGMIAWRHFSVGIIGIAGFGAFGAFIAYTRPESRVTDVIPSLIGGVLGMAALALLNLWTAQRAAPPASPASPSSPSSSRRAAYRSGWAA